MPAAETTSEPITVDSFVVVVVKAAAEGDSVAFAKLHDMFGPVAHAIALARLPPTDAEDLVQEVFVTVFHKLPSLRDPAAFPGWLATMTRNRVTDRLRTRKPADELLDHDAATPSRSEGRVMALDALRAIRRLPEAYHETLLMRLVEGMTGPEIAARTGLSPGSVRVNLHRGMKLLREELCHNGKGDE